MLTDTHCHLDIDSFDADRVDVIQRAQGGGITRILIPGLSLVSSRFVVNLAATHPILFAGIGVHPNEAGSWDGQTISGLKELVSSNSKIIAIGEIGLDYYWESSHRETQITILNDQLELASELHLPVVLHFREKNDLDHGDCGKDLMEILEGWIVTLRAEDRTLVEHPGVLHSFSGSLELAQKAIDLGFYIGVTGPVTYKNAEDRRRIIARLPLENLLIETDSPYLAPVPFRGKRNEPAFVTHIADKIAEIKSCTPQEVAAVTTANAERLFAWEEKL